MTISARESSRFTHSSREQLSNKLVFLLIYSKLFDTFVVTFILILYRVLLYYCFVLSIGFRILLLTVSF